MTLALLYRPELKEYDFGAGHPFRGDRYVNFARFLREKLPEDSNYRVIAAEPVTDADLRLICTQDYIEFTTQFYRAANLGLSLPAGFYRYQSGDNSPSGRPGKLEEAARIVVGQAKKACDLVQAGEYKKAVSIGGGLHHAKRSYGEGFCLYNDVAFCGMYLIEEYKLERVVILDTDAHAGNGTSEYFYDDPHVLLIDLHQDPGTIYPGTGFADQIGAGAGKGYNVNVPLPVHAGDRSYKLAFEQIVEPLIREFQPQLIVRNGGSDPHFADGLTNLGLTVDGFHMIGERVRRIAGEVCEGKVIDLTCSGYNEKVLPGCWLAAISGLADFKLELKETEPIPETVKRDPVEQTDSVIDEVKEHLSPYWQSLR